MPISRAIARRVTEAVPSAAICALATVLISATVARRSRSRRVAPTAAMLTDDTLENTIHNSEAPSLFSEGSVMSATSDLHVVLGATGGTGGAVVRELAHRGLRARAVSRRGDADVPSGVERVAADVA